MLERALALTRDYDMLPLGCRVLCAVSGGADSMALLHWLRGREGITLHAAHFDHQLRGEDSCADAAFVRETCQRWGVPCHMGMGDVRSLAKAEGLTLEEAARKLRYAFLEETAQTLGESTRIATAHNADDNAETLILNLVRGTGIRGLGGIPPVRVTGAEGIRLIRPLLTTTRAQILDYLRENGLDHREDATNADQVYARNRVRHQIMPLLRELNPRAVERMGETARQLRDLDEALNRQAEDALAHVRVEENRAFLPRTVLEHVSQPARAMLIQGLLDRLGAGRKDFGAIHLKAILELKPGGHLDLPSGVGVDFRRGMFTFVKRDPHYNPRKTEEAHP